MGAEKVAGFVIGGAIALYILYSLLPSVFELFGDMTFDDAPTGAEPIVGATVVVFVALVLWVMWQEMS